MGFEAKYIAIAAGCASALAVALSVWASYTSSNEQKAQAQELKAQAQEHAAVIRTSVLGDLESWCQLTLWEDDLTGLPFLAPTTGVAATSTTSK